MPAHGDHQLIVLGTIAKAHGLKGDLIMVAEQEPEAIRELSHVFIRDHRRDLIPHRLENFRPEGDSDYDTFFVKLAFIDDRTTAERLVGSKLYGELEDEPRTEAPDSSGLDIERWPVYDEEQHYIGTVTEVMEMPAHYVISVDREEQDPLLIPEVSEYISSVDRNKQMLVVRNIDQLEPDE